MSLLEEIVRAGDARLSTPCAEIEEITDEVRDLAYHMLDVMYAASGCGLAAPQIGKLVRMVVIDVDYDGEDERTKEPYVLINPVITTLDGDEVTNQEGCLSFPGISVPVKRPEHIVVEAYNLDGELMEYEAHGNLMAICLQHEIDHINGTTMVDHLSVLEKAEALKRTAEAAAQGACPGSVE